MIIIIVTSFGMLWLWPDLHVGQMQQIMEFNAFQGERLLCRSY